MLRTPVAAVAACLLALLTGCGDSAQPTENTAEQAALQRQDFPRGSEARPGGALAGAPCDPTPYLRKAETAKSAMFRVGPSSVQQVVGIFSTPAEAKAAVSHLVSRARQKCILEAIASYAVVRTGKRGGAEILPPRNLSSGDEARLLSFSFSPGPSRAHVYIASMRVKRGVSEILFLDSGEKSPLGLIEQLSGRAARRLSAVLG